MKDPRVLTDTSNKYTYNAWDIAYLTEEESKKLIDKIEKDNALIKNDIEITCRTPWETFYKNHKTNFYKDRSWILKDYPFIFNKRVLDAGCGVGNSLFNLKNAVGCDFSENAISLAKERLPNLTFFVHDLTSDEEIEGKFDVILLIFTLSAIDPIFHKKILKKLKNNLNDGGIIIIKDFGYMDFRQQKYKSEQIIKHNFYKRGDNTFTYFFKEHELIDMATELGFVPEIKMLNTLTVNRKRLVEMFRVTISGILRLK